MKQIQLLLLAGAICCLSSCGKKSEGGMSDAAKKNLDAMHGVTKCIDGQDFTKLSDYIAADAVDHSDAGDVKGLDSIKANLMKYGQQSENMSTVTVKEMADDEYVMSWMIFKGTSKMDGMGMKKGEKYEMNAVEVSKFKDGKAIEHWTFVNPAEMMKMMGNMSQPNMEPAKDTMTHQ